MLAKAWWISHVDAPRERTMITQTLSRLGRLCFVTALLVISACGPTPEPPGQLDVGSVVEVEVSHSEWLLIQPRLIRPLRSPGVGNHVNFKFFMIVQDRVAPVPGFCYPSTGVHSVAVGDRISIEGVALAVDKTRLNGDLPVYFLAVHEPDPTRARVAEAIIGALASWIVDAFASGRGSLIQFVLEVGTNLLTSTVADWLTSHEHNVIGEQIYPLRSYRDWESGTRISFMTQDGGMEVVFEVSTAREVLPRALPLKHPVPVPSAPDIRGSVVLACPHPRIQITYPKNGTVLEGAVNVQGTANYVPFLYYKVSIKQAHLPDKDENWFDLTPCHQHEHNGTPSWYCIERPVEDDLLCSFHVAQIRGESGDYHLRLRVVDATGNYGKPGERDCVIFVRARKQ